MTTHKTNAPELETPKSQYSIPIREFKLNKTKIYLLGTAHVSHESVADVKRAIRELEPDHIAVELDENRARNLLDPDRWKKMDIVQVIKDRKIYVLFASMMLSIFQKKIGDRLTSAPGDEFKAALLAAQKQNTQTSLIDRDIQITLKRAAQKLHWYSKIRLFSELIVGLFVREEIDSKQIEEMKQTDIFKNILESLPPAYHNIKKTLIDERDEYMSQKIRDLALNSEEPPKKILAVVGAGHLAGMEIHLFKENNLKSLTHLKKKSFWSKVVSWSIPILILLGGMLILSYFMKKNIDIQNAITTWIVVKCSVTAIMSAIWMPHITAWIAATLMSPISNFVPVIKAGWIAALFEAIFRKPLVTDFEMLADATDHFKTFYRNRVLRIFSIFFLTEFSRLIGTILFFAIMSRS